MKIILGLLTNIYDQVLLVKYFFFCGFFNQRSRHNCFDFVIVFANPYSGRGLQQLFGHQPSRAVEVFSKVFSFFNSLQNYVY